MMKEINRRDAIKRVGVLLGGALSAPAVSGVLGGCRASPGSDWSPATLSAEQNDRVIAISETIIPETDTPGARAAQVNRFIDKMLTEWYPAEERRAFMNGLDATSARFRRRFSKPFLEGTADEQHQFLAALDQEAFAPSGSDKQGESFQQTEDDAEVVRDHASQRGTGPSKETSDDTPQAGSIRRENVLSFFRTMKELTLLGYYTSEVGMTEELRYNNDMIPGRFGRCLPLEETRGHPGVGPHQEFPGSLV